MEVCVDTQIINTSGIGASLLQMCESIGVRCITRDQVMCNTITWQLIYQSETTSTLPRVEEMDEVLAVIPVSKFAALVALQSQASVPKSGDHSDQTLVEYVKLLQHAHPTKHLSVAVYGVEKYFSNLKLAAKRKHRQEVTGQKSKTGDKVQKTCEENVTQFQMEEAVVAVQLETGCCCHLVDSAQEVSDMVKCYTKAVMEKPNKKNRFDPVFSFLEEGSTGVKADKTGAGLLKMWTLQLQQLHNLGPEMAAAITAEFPSPLSLKQAYAAYPHPADAWKVTENILVRRGAGTLETSRRVGKQASRRIHILFTSNDPDLVIK